MARSLLFLLFLGTILPLAAQDQWLTTPVPDSPPVNQLHTDGNACGPACLLDAFRSGGAKWRKSLARIEGKDDAAKLKKIILTYGRRGSRLDPGRYRWNGRFGINLTDLGDIANELRTERWMPEVKTSILFRKKRESQEALLKRTHRLLSTSLKKGLPPILRVRRVAWRANAGSDVKAWLTVKRHFLVLTGLPAKLPRDATSFPVTYHDPWGGHRYRGTIQITDQKSSGLPTLVARFPESRIGRKLIRQNEPACLSLSSALGLF